MSWTKGWGKDEATKPRIGAVRIIEAFGLALFIVLLGIQVVGSVVFGDVKEALVGGNLPRSRSAEFAAFLGSRPDLNNAILVSDADFLLDTFPYYYLNNKIYFTRDRRYGNFVSCPRKAGSASA